MIPFVRSSLVLGSAALLVACGTQPVADGAATGAAAQFGEITAGAARAFTASLPDSTRAVAALPFEGPERTRMFFVPTVMVDGGRGGLPLSRMTPAQREAAWRLLGTGLSTGGLQTARSITANEALLHQIEMADTSIGDRWQRNPLTYFVSVFGTPAPAEPWGWRFEGHHLSVHVTNAGEEGPVVAPLFMGANPHRVLSGPTAGTRMLAREEDVARELVKMLDASQAARAIFSSEAWRDLRRRNDPAGRPLAFEGLPASSMTPAQQSKLRELVEVYAHRMADPAAQAQLDRIDQAGFGQLHFSWSGSIEPGEGHYYRVHGPTMLVEYDNAQNNANHSHTVWRDLQNDFGGDLLRKHYEQHPHGS